MSLDWYRSFCWFPLFYLSFNGVLPHQVKKDRRVNLDILRPVPHGLVCSSDFPPFSFRLTDPWDSKLLVSCCLKTQRKEWGCIGPGLKHLQWLVLTVVCICFLSGSFRTTGIDFLSFLPPDCCLFEEPLWERNRVGL